MNAIQKAIADELRSRVGGTLSRDDTPEQQYADLWGRTRRILCVGEMFWRLADVAQNMMRLLLKGAIQISAGGGSWVTLATSGATEDFGGEGIDPTYRMDPRYGFEGEENFKNL